MGKRLPPGEAARRAKERARAMYSGEKYKIGAVKGSETLWASIASAFVSGDATFLEDARVFAAGTGATGAHRKKNPNPLLASLGLDAMPTDLKALRAGYRTAVLTAFVAAGHSDSAPAYVAAFQRISEAYDRIKIMNGWQ